MLQEKKTQLANIKSSAAKQLKENEGALFSLEYIQLIFKLVSSYQFRFHLDQHIQGHQSQSLYTRTCSRSHTHIESGVGGGHGGIITKI